MTNPTPTPGLVRVNWKDQKAKLKAKFSTLTDEDLDYENGKKEEMFTNLEAKLGITKAELAAIIATL